MSDDGGFSEDDKSFFKTPGNMNDPLRRGKGTAYEGGVRTPIVIKAPGVAQEDVTTNVPASAYDLTPTLLSLAGLSAPAGMTYDGEDLTPVLDGSASARQDSELYWHFPHTKEGRTGPFSSVRDGDMKLIQFYNEDGSTTLELYDLANDIGETNNLASSDPSTRDALQNNLNTYLESVDAQMPAGHEFTAGDDAGFLSPVVTVDFDDPGDLTDNFAFNSVTENTADTKYDRQGGIGVGGSGGVDLQGNGAVATYDQQTFDLTDEGSSVSISLDSLYDAGSDADEFVINRVGLLSNAGDGFGAANRALANLNNDSGGSSGAGDELLSIGWDDNGFDGMATPFTLSDDTWYRLIATFTAVGADELEIVAELFALGADGTSEPIAVTSFSKTVIAADLRADPTLYAGWKIAGGSTGSGAIVADNFEVIPEPSALLLMGAGGLAMLARRPRGGARWPASG